MGSYQFFSPEGRSKIHGFILEEIGLVKKELDWEDREFIHRFERGNFEDFMWIAGRDRRYYAQRIRSIIAAEPVGEWSKLRGRTDIDPEVVQFRDRCKAAGIRPTGLASIADHFEESDETPIVITFSVTNDFPSSEFRPRPEDGKEVVTLKQWNAMTEEEAWNTAFAELVKRRPDLQVMPCVFLMEVVLAKLLDGGVDIDRVVRAALMGMALRDESETYRVNSYARLSDEDKALVDAADKLEDDHELDDAD